MATLLILLIVIGLSFVLFTANIGNLSVQSTALANSADAAAMQLSSNLSTKSRQLYEGLGNRVKKCYKTGFLHIILAVVVAIVAIIVTFGTAFPVVATMWELAMVSGVGALGGAVGGAIGGAIVYGNWTGVGQGALMGAGVGAAVGSLCAGIGGMMNPTTTVSSSTGTQLTGQSATSFAVPNGATAGEMTAAGEFSGNALVTGQGIATSGSLAAPELGSLPQFAGTALIHAGEAMPAGSTLMAGAMTIPAAAGTLTALTGGLGIASGAYLQSERQQALNDYIDNIAKMFGKASEKDRMTQTTIMRAMGGVVDDPNMSPDVNDSNYNNNTTELVSDYQVWWWRRANGIAKIDANSIANSLVSLDGLQAFICGLLGGGMGFIFVAPDLFVSQEYMWPTDLTLPEDQLDILLPGKDPEGLLAHSFRALESSGVDLSFWEPGPQYDVYTAAYQDVPDDDCTGAACDVPPPPGYDRFDMVVATLREIYLWIAALRQQSASDLAATWDDWIYFVYDVAEDPTEDPTYNPYAEPPATLYGMLTLVIYEMQSWMAEIDALYPTWPECQYNEYGEFVTAPCRTDFGSWWKDASFDTVPDYEYSQLQSWLGTWGPMLFDFLRSALKGLANFGYGGEIPGGKNPATYEWNDARGRHRVRVRLGNFEIPRIVKKKYGNWLKGKTCMELWYYSDGDTYARKGNDRNYVEVSRYDQPSGQAAIGRWNPLNRSVTKRAYYSYGFTWDDVHLRHAK